MFITICTSRAGFLKQTQDSSKVNRTTSHSRTQHYSSQKLSWCFELFQTSISHTLRRTRHAKLQHALCKTSWPRPSRTTVEATSHMVFLILVMNKNVVTMWAHTCVPCSVPGIGRTRIRFRKNHPFPDNLHENDGPALVDAPVLKTNAHRERGQIAQRS